jgi:hypothetical protein
MMLAAIKSQLAQGVLRSGLSVRMGMNMARCQA